MNRGAQESTILLPKFLVLGLQFFGERGLLVRDSRADQKHSPFFKMGTLGGVARTARITRRMLRRLENNLASVDVVNVLRTHWMDMPCFVTVMPICSFHPFKERKSALSGIDNKSTVLVTGRKLVEGIGGVLMLAIYANVLPFLCSRSSRYLISKSERMETSCL